MILTSWAAITAIAGVVSCVSSGIGLLRSRWPLASAQLRGGRRLLAALTPGSVQASFAGGRRRSALKPAMATGATAGSSWVTPIHGAGR